MEVASVSTRPTRKRKRSGSADATAALEASQPAKRLATARDEAASDALVVFKEVANSLASRQGSIMSRCISVIPRSTQAPPGRSVSTGTARLNLMPTGMDYAWLKGRCKPGKLQHRSMAGTVWQSTFDPNSLELLLPALGAALGATPFEHLGTDTHCIKLVPYRLEIHEEGAFFDRYLPAEDKRLCMVQDTVGLLVVGLPVRKYTGGGLRIKDAHQDKWFEVGCGSESKREIWWAACYLGCEQQLTPVLSGSRVTFSFRIVVKPRQKNPDPIGLYEERPPLSDEEAEEVVEYLAEAGIAGPFGVILSQPYLTQHLTPDGLRDADKTLYEGMLQKGFHDVALVPMGLFVSHTAWDRIRVPEQTQSLYSLDALCATPPRPHGAIPFYVRRANATKMLWNCHKTEKTVDKKVFFQTYALIYGPRRTKRRTDSSPKTRKDAKKKASRSESD